MSLIRLLPLLCAAAVLLPAQDWYPKHNLTVGGGAALPRGDLGSYLTDAPGFTVGYGYRFNRYLQADLGLDILFGAADVRDFLNTGIGTLRISDRQYFVPMGGRAILPLAGGRLLLYGGGGGAFMRYNERVRQPNNFFRIDCPSCTARSGWGYYSTGGVNVFVDRGQRIRLGAAAKVYRGNTEGQPLGNIPGFRTKDNWLQMFVELGFSF